MTSALGMELNWLSFLKLETTEISRHCMRQSMREDFTFLRVKCYMGASRGRCCSSPFHSSLRAGLGIKPKTFGPGVHPHSHGPSCPSWECGLTPPWAGHPPCALTATVLSLRAAGHQGVNTQTSHLSLHLWGLLLAVRLLDQIQMFSHFPESPCW